MWKRSDSWWARYGVALLAVLVVTALRRLLGPVVGDQYPIATVWLAAMFSAWYGGFGPSLLASLLGLLAAVYFLVPANRPSGGGQNPALAIFFYVLISFGIASLGGLMRRARRRIAGQIEELHRRHEQLQATLRSIGDAVIVTDEHCRVTLLNPIAETLTGWKSAAAIGRPLDDVLRLIHELTRQPVESPVARVLRGGTVVGLTNHTLLVAKDQTERPIDDSAAPIRDPAGRLIGAVLVIRDIAERQAAEAANSRLAAIVESSGDAIVSQSLDGIITSWNAGAERIYGYSAQEVVGRPFSILVPADRTREVELTVGRVIRGERIEHFETVRQRQDGRLIDVSVSHSPLTDRHGRLAGTAVITRDVSERRQAERTASFLAGVSEALASVVDLKSTLEKLARLAVPLMADWCCVDLVDAEGQLQRMTIAHRDPAKVLEAQELYRRWRPDPAHSHGSRKVHQTGVAKLIPEISAGRLAHANPDPALLAGLQKLGLCSYIGVPLMAHGKTLGVIEFFTAESGRRYGERDLELAKELAHRAAVAIENAELYQALRESDRKKDEFLALLAHELRNPLAPVASALSILQQPELDPATAAAARDMAERQLAHLKRLVDDLLDVSRIMRGKIELRKERVSLAALVARAVETARPLIEAERHELTVSIPPAPVELQVDVVRIAQVLGNLLSNAAEYTPAPGHIWLTARAADGYVTLSVRDTGIGIAPDVLPRLFEMFMQVAPGNSRSQGGLGIGLTLVKNLVEMHGGAVEATSAGLGQGSEFLVRLPLAVEPLAAPAATPPEPSQTTASRASRRLLIVDDNVDAAQSLAILLRLQGHEVRAAHSGEEALAAVAARPPELVLLDIGMPGMNGLEVARKLRQEYGPDRLKLVALTGWGQEQDRRRSQAAGFDHHLTKPVDLATLRAVIDGAAF